PSDLVGIRDDAVRRRVRKERSCGTRLWENVVRVFAAELISLRRDCRWRESLGWVDDDVTSCPTRERRQRRAGCRVLRAMGHQPICRHLSNQVGGSSGGFPGTWKERGDGLSGSELLVG